MPVTPGRLSTADGDVGRWVGSTRTWRGGIRLRRTPNRLRTRDESVTLSAGDRKCNAQPGCAGDWKCNAQLSGAIAQCCSEPSDPKEAAVWVGSRVGQGGRLEVRVSRTVTQL
jgi:hypothetical protein